MDFTAKKERAGLAVARQPFLVFFNRNAMTTNRAPFQAILAIALAASVLFLPATESSAAGEGRFFILLGKAFAETMLELQGQ